MVELVCFFIILLSILVPRWHPVSGGSLVPSENFVPRYKENGGNAAFLTADYADITDGEHKLPACFLRQLAEKPFKRARRLLNRR